MWMNLYIGHVDEPVHRFISHQVSLLFSCDNGTKIHSNVRVLQPVSRFVEPFSPVTEHQMGPDPIQTLTYHLSLQISQNAFCYCVTLSFPGRCLVSNAA
ncbi:hypothetical protein EYF80_047416 [Liparis tanakae]|uniref:Uncharacterized protein n=1 Tax=Liparis tanakae TaxID=230148 RepID=A0A4Z2FNR0_9TELE|nr:hypothetical protein EYF80_047416 [Liparis tanakae]